MAQNNRADEYINSTSSHCCLNSDRSDSYSDNDGDSYSGVILVGLVQCVTRDIFFLDFS